jgi:hypothetical protein
MNRVMCCCAMIAFGVANLVGASAQTLTLEIEMRDLETWISNHNGFAIDNSAYQLTSPSGILDPAGWRSIADAALSDPVMVSAALGGDALTFDQLGSSDHELSEVNIFSHATWQPGTRWSIGHPFGASRSEFRSRPFDATFRYVEPSVGIITGAIELIPVPEPAAAALIAGAVIGMACSHYRRRSLHRHPN